MMQMGERFGASLVRVLPYPAGGLPFLSQDKRDPGPEKECGRSIAIIYEGSIHGTQVGGRFRTGSGRNVSEL